MKKYILIFAFLACALPVIAQPITIVDPNKPDSLLTKDEANIRLTEWRGRVQTLQSRLEGLNKDVTAANGSLTSLKANIASCQAALYALVGATEASVRDFRERLGRIDNRVREIGTMSDADIAGRRNEIDSLDLALHTIRQEKVALLPEFYNKIIDIGNAITALRNRHPSNANSYTVGTWAKDRDCLWNIAGRTQTYGDPLMWPKIWLANTDKIRNPDIIHPGDVLTIPAAGAKTGDELRQERLYYRHKSAGRRTVVREDQVQQQDAGSGAK